MKKTAASTSVSPVKWSFSTYTDPKGRTAHSEEPDQANPGRLGRANAESGGRRHKQVVRGAGDQL